VEATDNLSPLILTDLLSVDAKGISKEECTSLPILKSIAKSGADFTEAISNTLDSLLKQGLVAQIEEKYSLTDNAREKVKECQVVRETEKDQAYGQFCLNLKASYGSLTDTQLHECRNLAEEVIVTSFANRGLTIANQIFTDQSASPGELSDIFGFVSDTATKFEDMGLRAAFVESMHQFLMEPNPPQRKYLASVSQGYFLFHLLGLDPKCAKIRRDIFQNTLWLFDSNVLLPLAAVGCFNHEYAVELFQTLKVADAMLYTTNKVLQEAWEHLEWALNFIKTNGVESPEFLQAALVKGSYNQNLFLDGYIRLSADGQIGTFKDYLKLILPQGTNRHSFEKCISQTGVCVRSITDMNGFAQEDWGEIEEAKTNIQTERERLGTYHSPFQVETEAEVWVLLNYLRTEKYTIDDLESIEKVYFVSQSRILDMVFQPEIVTTWTPEALYRYISILPDKQPNPDLFQQCMLHEYYYAGVSFIDKDRYVRFFGPSIDTAKVLYEQEKSKYIAEIEEAYLGQLDEAFEKIPDLEKPFFVAQMGWRLAEVSQQREEQTRQRALEAEAKVKELETEKDKAWKTREKRRQEQETARLKNLQDPKHVRKRLRQAKKRKRKKKK